MPMPKMATFSVEDGALAPPCRFCGYNGPNYYQAGTHAKNCPWHNLGGLDERKVKLIEAINAAAGVINSTIKKTLADLESSAVLEETRDTILMIGAENAAFRRLLWLWHCGQAAECDEPADMVCRNCGADFKNMTPAELERCLWRCKKGD